MSLKSFLFITFIGLLGMFSGCAQVSEHIVEEPGTIQAENNSVNTDTPIQVDDLMTTLDWIGKTREELGITSDKIYSVPKIEGNIFDYPASGDITFETQGTLSAKQINIIVPKSSLQDFYIKLNDLYGGPAYSGMEPYVAVNGGALEWYTFDAGNTLIRIQQGNQADYVVVAFTANPQFDLR